MSLMILILSLTFPSLILHREEVEKEVTIWDVLFEFHIAADSIIALEIHAHLKRLIDDMACVVIVFGNISFLKKSLIYSFNFSF